MASFELSDAQKALKGRERTDALQKLSDASWEFDKNAVDKGSQFAALAKQASVPVTTSTFFTAEQPDPALSAKIPQLATTAFHLTRELPVSDVVQGRMAMATM